MKEFDKKGNPSRDPSSEGMKGLSKFLPVLKGGHACTAATLPFRCELHRDRLIR